MPIFDYLCKDCGKITEILVTSGQEKNRCGTCGSSDLKKMLSAHSSLSGAGKHSMPGPGDTACCGSSPGHGSCAGPGSCCGKNPF
ncbi:MAG: FmdB family transcriptional regulator [Desulfobacteraceae bacterium IS3]|nr:MAG: FmdB family transcriptional regulator [Desulfobacteraceae bacterium IS3]